MLHLKALIRAFFIGIVVLLIMPPTLALAEENVATLSADLLFGMVNKHRTELKLPVFEKDEKICTIATNRAPQLYNEIYVNGPMHKGFYALNLPYWATENIIYMRNEQEALNWWLNSPIHKSAIEGNSKYSCIACAGQSCSEIFTSFEPKIASSSPL